jgi:hypothetical protein
MLHAQPAACSPPPTLESIGEKIEVSVSPRRWVPAREIARKATRSCRKVRQPFVIRVSAFVIPFWSRTTFRPGAAPIVSCVLEVLKIWRLVLSKPS